MKFLFYQDKFLSQQQSQSNYYYDFTREHSPDLKRMSAQYSDKRCARAPISDPTQTDLDEALLGAKHLLKELANSDKNYLQKGERHLNFSMNLYQATVRTKFNECVTKILSKR